jgi:hypothetical protein
LPTNDYFVASVSEIQPHSDSRAMPELAKPATVSNADRQMPAAGSQLSEPDSFPAAGLATGTLTRNELAVGAVRAMAGFDEARVLSLAALASSEGGQDPVDAAVRAAAGTMPMSRSVVAVTAHTDDVISLTAS